MQQVGIRQCIVVEDERCAHTTSDDISKVRWCADKRGHSGACH